LEEKKVLSQAILYEDKQNGSSLVHPKKDCQIPPLRAGRHYTNFRKSYEAGFAELQTSLVLGKKHAEDKAKAND
jgi:hypothetical protein